MQVKCIESFLAPKRTAVGMRCEVEIIPLYFHLYAANNRRPVISLGPALSIKRVLTRPARFISLIVVLLDDEVVIRG